MDDPIGDFVDEHRRERFEHERRLNRLSDFVGYCLVALSIVLFLLLAGAWL